MSTRRDTSKNLLGDHECVATRWGAKVGKRQGPQRGGEKKGDAQVVQRRYSADCFLSIVLVGVVVVVVEVVEIWARVINMSMTLTLTCKSRDARQTMQQNERDENAMVGRETITADGRSRRGEIA
jgi:hypothetical protein